MTEHEKKPITLEIEKRWHLKNLADLPFDYRKFPKVSLIQGYIRGKPQKGKKCQTTRVRKELRGKKAFFWLTTKTGKGTVRTEEEYLIEKKIFELLFCQVDCKLRKTRYFIPWNGAAIQLNIFHGKKLKDYYQIEVEFNTEEEAFAFVAPPWFGLEVTDDGRHGNRSLAKDGKPSMG